MIASLMMYARPQLEGAHDRFWQLIRSNLRDVGIDSPEKLSQDAEEFSVWRDPELVLSQTCGMPYRTWLHDQVELVGTPDYGLSDCPPGFYRSVSVVREGDSRESIEDFRDAQFAFNQTFSQSGFAAVYWHCQPQGFFFENRLQTGGHLASARAVAEGRADIASLDAVSWRLMREYEPFARDLRVLEYTSPTPGLPLITAKGNDTGLIFSAVQRSIAQLASDDRELLGVGGLVRLAKADYLAVSNPPVERYPESITRS